MKSYMLLVKKLFVKISVSFFLSGFLFAQKNPNVTSRKGFVSQIGNIKMKLNSKDKDDKTNLIFNSTIFFDSKLLIEESLFDSFKNWEKKKKGLEGLLGDDGRDEYDGVAHQIVKDIDKEIRWTRELFKKSDFNINLVFGF
ncbi:hypothetical protein [uncultured Tenacibaculum sp.]|uniref:hypothetical protein n=1 Tax=uncultured Tenacibaculum sp. TaxID=174713 RepID=UPI00260B7CB0|nr:hypothetical protein [uncultured Tenacibaculum sp.]